MKPFDLEAAKAGATVCTRNGHNARIICYDAKGRDYPMIALVESDPGRENIMGYATSGRMTLSTNPLDLMMATVKKEGWVNINCNPAGSSEYLDHCVYSSKEEALKQIGDRWLATVKIEWEE